MKQLFNMYSVCAYFLFFILIEGCNEQKVQSQIETLGGTLISSDILDAKIDSIIHAVNMPGLSLAIINENKVVYHNVFGVSNNKTDAAVNKNTIFEAASLSKPIFAYFTMKMVENGKLDLDKPLYQYLEHPNIADTSKEDYKLITARMVLSHRTGFPNHTDGNEIELAFKPGTDFMYSGEGYQYLANVISKINGIDSVSELNDLFQLEVTQPLKMKHSSFVWNNYLKEHKAFGHDKNGLPILRTPPYSGWNGKTFSAYSSLHSEALEYSQFLIALLKKEGLKEDTFTNLYKEHTHFKDSNPLKQQIGQTGWGLGMAQKPSEYGFMHMHTGNNHNFQSYMMILPDKEFGIVFFTNSDKSIPFIQGLDSVIGPIF